MQTIGPNSRRGALAAAGPAILLVCALAAVALVLICTWQYGPGLSPDSVHYVSTARNLAAGRGYVCYDGRPYVSWPPLFPTMLAAFGAAGVDEVSAARYVNAFAFGAIVALAGAWVLKKTGSLRCVLAICLLLLTSMPLLEVSVYVWTEPLFVLAAVAFVILSKPLLVRPTLARAAMVGLVAAAACLTRYVGVTLILTGLTLLAVARGAGLKKRLQAMAVFAVVASLPLGLWLARNWSVTGTLTGERPPSLLPPATVIAYAGRDLGLGLLPLPIMLRLPGLGLFLLIGGVLALALVLAAVSYARQGDRSLLLATLPASLLTVIYVATLIVMVARAGMDAMGTRLLAPTYPLMLLVLVHWAHASRRRGRAGKEGAGHSRARAAIGAATIFLTVGLIVASACRMPERVRMFYADGIGYGSKAWRNSPTIAYLRARPLEGPILSNRPDVIYLLTGRGAALAPRRTPYQSDEFIGVRERARVDAVLAASGAGHLVWIDLKARPYLYGEDELKEWYVLEQTAAFADGRLYRIAAKAP